MDSLRYASPPLARLTARRRLSKSDLVFRTGRRSTSPRRTRARTRQPKVRTASRGIYAQRKIIGTRVETAELISRPRRRRCRQSCAARTRACRRRSARPTCKKKLKGVRFLCVDVLDRVLSKRGTDSFLPRSLRLSNVARLRGPPPVQSALPRRTCTCNSSLLYRSILTLATSRADPQLR